MSTSASNFNGITIGKEGANFSNVKVPAVITPTEQLTDGGFENQNTVLYPDSWELYDIASDGNAVAGSWGRSEDPQAGTYAMELIANQAIEGGEYLSAAISGSYDTAVATKTIQQRFYAKTNVAVGTIKIKVGSFYAYDGTDYVWNLTAGDWVELGGVSDDDNNWEDINPTSSRVQYTNTQRTLPADVDEYWHDTFVNTTSSDDSVVIDGLEWLLDGVDIATDGGFENWTAYANQTTPLDDWAFVPGENWEFSGNEVSDSEYINFSTDGSDNVVEMHVKGIGNVKRGYLRQTITGTPGTEVDCSAIVETKSSDSQTPYLIAMDANAGSQTEIWDFVGTIWDTLGTTVTDLPGTSNSLTLSGTGSFVSNDAGTITIPDSGTLVLYLMSDDGNSPTGQYSYYFKTASAVTNEETPGVQIQQFPFRSQSALTDLEANDRIVEFTFGEGEGSTGLAITMADEGEEELDAVWSSDVPGRQNLSNFDLVVDDPTEDYNPTTKEYVDVTLTTVSNFCTGGVAIDYKQIQANTLYTVPVGYQFIATHCLQVTTGQNTPSGDATATLGGNDGTFDDIEATVTSPGTTVGDVTEIQTFSSGVVQAAGSVISLAVTGADSGTALNAKFYLFGILEAV